MSIIIFAIGVIGLIAITIYQNKQLEPTENEFAELKKANLVPVTYVDFKSLSRREKKQLRLLTQRYRIFIDFAQRFRFANPDKKFPLPTDSRTEN